MISNRQKLECALREIRKRQQVYPGYVERGRMSQSKANYEIEVMTAIADDYRKLADADEPALFEQMR